MMRAARRCWRLPAAIITAAISPVTPSAAKCSMLQAWNSVTGMRDDSALRPVASGREEHAASGTGIIRLPNRAPHRHPCCLAPGTAHAFAGVAAPAFAEGVTREAASVDAR